MMTSRFYLKVQRIEPVCTFELAWGRGQQISVQVSYPETLTTLYHTWQTAYLEFYRAGQRARPGASGAGTMPAIDWRAKLVQAEAALLSEFHYWLGSADLLELRSHLARAAHQSEAAWIEVFLTGDPMEIIRLPWEAWEIATEFGTTKPIRFVRMPMNVRAASATLATPRRRMRILVILGDDTGLEFDTEKAALKSLQPMADVVFVGWRVGNPGLDVKTQIRQAIANPKGWDVLFFAGHSNETMRLGGELMVAPDVSMLMQELLPDLAIAQANGLQFAVFNSCKGINLAQTLIDAGLREVAVMREPISNAVAQEFLVQFIQSLGQCNDAHTALLHACDYLKLEKSVTYPSAHLIPSVFRHPDSRSFQPRPFGWRQRLKQGLPTRREAFALAACLGLSLLPPVRSTLLEQRLWAQSLYRDLTHQVPPATNPPVTLIQIDEESIQKAGISNPQPMDRQYLAKLVDQLTQHQAKVIGIDYFLDRPQPLSDPALATAVRKAVAENATWFSFGAYLDDTGKQVGVLPMTQIASRDWSMQGYTNAPLWYMALPKEGNRCTQCPFAYVLAMSQALQSGGDAPQPRLSAVQNDGFLIDMLAATDRLPTANPQMQFLRTVQESSLTPISRLFGQIWWQPILDFSIPPDRVFKRIPSWHLLDPQKSAAIGDLSQTVVMIAPGGYGEAGIDLAKGRQRDVFDLPAVIAHWQPQSTYFTGGEGLAYMVHHWLNQRLVIPVPDTWMVVLAAAAAKGLQFVRWRRRALIGGAVAYGILSLQLFVSGAILLPIVLPGLIVSLYHSPLVRRKFHD